MTDLTRYKKNKRRKDFAWRSFHDSSHVREQVMVIIGNINGHNFNQHHHSMYIGSAQLRLCVHDSQKIRK